MDGRLRGHDEKEGEAGTKRLSRNSWRAYFHELNDPEGMAGASPSAASTHATRFHPPLPPPESAEKADYPLVLHAGWLSLKRSRLLNESEQTAKPGVSRLLFVAFASQRCPNGGGKPIRCLPGRGHCTIQYPLSRVVRQGRPAPDHMVEGLIAQQLIRREQARRAVFVALCNLQASVQ